jgi:dTDP-4-amino-4,6-dideoxygalactose transaminase
MSRWRVPLADVVIGPEEIEAVADVLRSGWLSTGPRTAEFEADLASYAGAGHAVAVTNCTSALHMICLATGCGPGDEVVVPSLSFAATANAVAYTGARPVFADIVSPLEPWLGVESVHRALTPRTRAVMTMSYGGHSGEIDGLAELCSDRGLVLLEDAAHGLGSRLQARMLGTWGAAGAYSFFSNKNLAAGEGGAVVTDDGDLAARLRLLRSHGMTSLSWDRHRGHASAYDVVTLGFNYRIDEPRAALLSQRLRALDEQNLRRATLVERYREALAGTDLELPMASRTGLRSAHHLFCVLLPGGVDRHAFREALAERGIQTSMHYPPIHRFSIYEDAEVSLPLTDDYAARSVTLPLFAHMSTEQQDLVVEAVLDALPNVRAAPVA